MTARGGTVLAAALRSNRRSLLLWALAVAAVTALYTAFYPSVGGGQMDAMLESMPSEFITAMGFDSMATAAGYVTSTVYALLGAVLTLVCASAWARAWSPGRRRTACSNSSSPPPSRGGGSTPSGWPPCG
ncbi:hypothetical protein [Kocuria rosea]|uniref:hypothetical protein n=1 Tax=Kocuria rosea TaxID=1275 RepID=UPI000D6465F0|nr:hypothetical protein [Kocuria rosea]PWF83878.1 hypothetical protein DEJ37_13535 [Kocuria rosea]